jgi:hypothetical protein
MASSSEHRHHSRRAAAAVAAALVVTGLAAEPSSARQDRGTPVVAVANGSDCPLQRVGTQFVRCDDLTGNGVPAPGYVPER